MTEASLEQETASSLLLELARALRARQFYPPTHPTLKATLERTLAVWHEGLSKVEELRLELRGGSLLLPDGTRAGGPGIDDIAKALRLRRVRRLRVHCGLEAQELLVLIDALAQNAESLEQLGGLEQSLLRAGVRHITTSEMDFAELSHRAQLPVPPPPNDDPEDDTDPAPQGRPGTFLAGRQPGKKNQSNSTQPTGPTRELLCFDGVSGIASQCVDHTERFPADTESEL